MNLQLETADVLGFTRNIKNPQCSTTIPRSTQIKHVIVCQFVNRNHWLSNWERPRPTRPTRPWESHRPSDPSASQIQSHPECNK